MRDTDLLITAADVERWMDFSEDRNPIHFDRKAARLFGVTEPFAHGMLSMFPMKNSVLADGSESWSSVDIRLSRPIFLNNCYHLVWDGEGRGVVTPKAISRSLDVVSAYCTYQRREHLDIQKIYSRTRSPISELSYRAAGDLTIGDNSTLSYSRWILLEASAFATFLRMQQATELIPELRLLSGEAFQQQHSSLLHIRHTVSFNYSTFNIAREDGSVALEFSVSEPKQTSTRDGIIISFELTSYVNGEAVVVSSPRLLLRKNR